MAFRKSFGRGRRRSMRRGRRKSRRVSTTMKRGGYRL